MLLNYTRIALRNLLKYKAFSIINIAGMAISLGSCLLITLYVTDELAYDRHHPDGDRTYRIYNTVNHEGAESEKAIVPYPFALYMEKDFPEVESTLRLMDTYGDLMFELGDKRLTEPGGIFAEPTVFDMLTIKVVHGRADSALVRAGTVALSASLSKKYFGDINPVGQVIKINGNDNEVTAVYEDTPEQFHLRPRYFISFASTGWAGRFDDNWQRQQLFTYLKLVPGSDAKTLEAKFLPFVEKYAYAKIKEAGFTYVPHLQNIKDIHLHSSNFEWEIAQRGDAQSVYILIATAVMIILIASLNFINLSTARAVKRMKEVGIRKVAGAFRRQLVFQFLSESIVITAIAMVIAMVIAEVSMPFLNEIVQKHLFIPYGPAYIVGAVLGCIALGALAGSYPALYLSRFRPAAVLSGKAHGAGGATFFRQGLVVVQFMLSFFLICGSTIVFYQNDLVHNKDLGFDKDQLLVVPLTGPQLRNPEATKEVYANHPNVVSVTIGLGLPGDIIPGDGVIDPVTKKEWSANLFCVDYDYVSTLGMDVIAGRGFSRDFPADSSTAFMVNETFLKTYGLGDPETAIGRELDWKRWDNQNIKHGRIIGVVRDFHFRSLRDKVAPVVFQIFPSSWKMAARIKPTNVEETIAHFKKTYEALDPSWIFSYNFLDENFEAMYKTEQTLGTLFSVFTYLAIAVACLGLFGLVEYSVNQRTKEVSIRKILGADVSTLLLLLTRRYFVLLLIAIVIVTPLSYFAAREWLNNFAYHIEIEPMIFIQAALVVLGVTAITVSYQSVKAALANPATTLKNE